MTLPFSVEIVPVMWVFGAWAALSIAYFLHGASTRRVAEPPSVSPFLSERSAQARRAEISRQRFGPRGWAHMLFATGIAGVLLYLAKAGSLWAAVCFAVVSLWLMYDHIATPIALTDIGSDLVDTLDRAYYATGVAVWAYALVCILFPDGKLLAVLP